MLEKLIGFTADENSLFETLLFEVESNFEHYRANSYDIVLTTLGKNRFQIEKIISIKNTDPTTPPQLEYLKKKYWVSIEASNNKIDCTLCRKDLTIKTVVVFRNGETELYPPGIMVDPRDPPPRPMTDEEIRLAFQELCGILAESDQKKSKPKKPA